MSSDSPFVTDLRALLAKHNITAPRFCHGSKPFNPAKPQVLYSGPIYDTEEMVAATSALIEGKWAVAGEHVHRFETMFSTYLEQAESVAVNSGSSADLLMVAAAKQRYGWKEGEGVLVSPVGFPTSISAITLNGLTPVFIDIEWDTLNANNALIERQLQRYNEPWNENRDMWMPSPIRAILISPVLGNPPDMDELVVLAQRYNLKLLLDGCDSLGSTWRGKHLATYATASSCSFFPAHHVSTLQGGMISSNDTELIRMARCMGAWSKACYCTGAGNLLPNGCCGKRFDAWLPDQPDLIMDHRYVFVTDKAYNTQMTDVQGALGCVQMTKVEAIHAARRVAYHCIAELFRSILGIEPRVALSHAEPSWFGVPMLCPSYAYKAALVAHLEGNGVQTRNAFAGHILNQPGYKHLGVAADYPNANEVLRKVFFIGNAPFLSEDHFNHIEATIKSFVPPTIL